VTFTWEQDDGGFKKAILRAIELNRRIDELGEAHERLAKDYKLSPMQFLRSWLLAVEQIRNSDRDPIEVAATAVARVLAEKNDQASRPLTWSKREATR